MSGLDEVVWLWLEVMWMRCAGVVGGGVVEVVRMWLKMVCL